MYNGENRILSLKGRPIFFPHTRQVCCAINEFDKHFMGGEKGRIETGNHNACQSLSLFDEAPSPSSLLLLSES